MPIVSSAVASAIVTSGISALTTAATNVFNYNSNVSVTQSAKRSSIRARSYIDSSLSSDPIVGNILRTAHTMYVGMILQTLQLQNLVTAGHSVGDALSSVSSHGMEGYSDTAALLSSQVEALESFASMVNPDQYDRQRADKEADYQRQRADRERDTEDARRYTEGRDAARRAETMADRAVAAQDESIRDVKSRAFVAKDTTPSPADNLPVGKMIDVTLTNPNDPKYSMVVSLLVQLLPYYVKPAVAELIVTLSSPATFKQRLVQMQAGEIHWLKDLILNRDLDARLERAVRQDTAGSFAEYLVNISKRTKNHIREAVFKGAQSSSNIANSVLIISEDNMKAAKAQTGFNIENRSQRDRFFKNSLSMMLFVVDQSYNTVTLYLNGVDDVGHYSFDNFSSSRKSDNVDIVQLMSALSQGRAPRF